MRSMNSSKNKLTKLSHAKWTQDFRICFWNRAFGGIWKDLGEAKAKDKDSKNK